MAPPPTVFDRRQTSLELSKTGRKPAIGASGMWNWRLRHKRENFQQRCKSHGLFRLPGYCSSLRSGKVGKVPC